MSAIRFTSQFLSDNGLIYNIEIWDRNYTGSSTKITLGSGGPKMIWESESEDRFTEILSSTCEIPLVIDNALLDDFLLDIRSSAYQERDVYVHVYFSNTSFRPLWSGFLLHELASTVDEYYPYEYRLRFTDGLSLLKEIDFVQEGSSAPYDSSEIYTDYNSFTYYIKEILLKSGSALTTEGASVNYRYRTAINWFNAGHGSGAPSSTLDPMAETKVKPSVSYNEDENNNFSVMNCYDVLKTLLKHWGARITYWRHTYWITQVSSFNTLDTGTFANPVNVRQSIYNYNQITTTSRVNGFNEATTLYETFLTSIANGKAVDKIKGTIYDFMAPVKEVEATYSTGNNENFFRGFPIPSSPNSTDTVVTQGTIIDGANASDFYLNIPLQFKQDRTGSLSLLSNGAFQFVSVKMFFELSATDGASTKYLRKNTPNQGGGFSWVTSAPTSVNSRPSWEYNQLNFGANPQVYYQTIGGGPDNGNAIFIPTDTDFVGAWTWSLKIFKQFNSSGAPHNDYVFTCLTTGQTTSDLSQIGLSYLNVLTQTNISQAFTNTPSGGITNQVFNLALVNNNAFAGLILALNSNAGISFSLQNILISSGNTRNSLDKDFGTLLFGDTPDNVSESAIKVDDQSGTTTFTNATGQWGVDTVSGNFTFSTLLLDEYLAGQSIPLKVGRFRLATGTKAIRQNDGTKSRLRFVNPITVLIEQQSPQDPTIRYGFIRGTFHLLAGEWDYEGFELDNATLTTTTTTTVVSGGAGPKAPDDGVIAFMTKPPNINNDLVSLNNVITTTKSAIEPIGTDLIADQYFASSSNWNLTTGWSITDNTAVLVTGEGDRTLTPSSDTLAASKNYRGVIIIDAITGTLQITDGSSVLKQFTEADGTGGHVFDFTTTAQYSALTITGDATTTTTLSFLQVNELQSTTSFDINAIGEAVFKTGDKFSLISLATGSVFDLTINSDQSASDTTLTITSTELKEIIPINSIVTFNKKNLIKQYQDDTLQEVTDNGNTTTNSIMIGSSSAPTQTLDVNGNINLGNNKKITFADSAGSAFTSIDYTNNSLFKIVQANSGELRLSVGFNDNSNNKITFFTQGSLEKMRITNDGNVGIGTSSPTRQLQVKKTDGTASIAITSSNTGLAQLELGGSSDNDIAGISYNGNTQKLFLKTNNTGQLYIDNSGNVGINESSPSFIIDANVTSSRVRFKATTGNANLELSSIDGRDYLISSISDGSFRIVDEDASSERMRITSDGNVGIGTSSPAQKLEIDGFILLQNNDEIRFKDSGGTERTAIELDASNDLNIGTSAGGNLKFINGSSYTERMRINSDGNVLIGTTSDSGGKVQAKVGANDTYAYYIANSSGSNRGGLYIDSSGNTQLKLRTGSGDMVSLKADGNSYFNGGNVGIGTATPQSKADINGTLRVIGQATPSGGAGLEIGYSGAGKLRSIDRDTTTYKLLDFIASKFTFKIDGTEKMRLSDDGFLGVGTSSPDSILHITKDQGGVSSSIKLENKAGANNTGFDIDFQLASSGISAKIAAIRTNSPGAGDTDLLFSTSTNGTSVNEAMRITSSANVGISTSTPETKLDVNGTCTSQLLQLRRQDSTPSEPETDKSIIFMDSSGDIKVLINVGGTTVTRTLATYA